ncbi:Cadherin-23 [Amphibalanus amphitrite]|uniref:Cadherin-23 n=1 Tax=Amphibalanus amphitrite TaxID=1232801 RepID=A0A6A4W878_AMPAM|nr:Cadherin-23 [Amphibalanus amphitrite]
MTDIETFYEGYDDVFKRTSTTKDGKPACQLRLLKVLDYETRPLYKLTITVKDTPDVRGTTFNSSVTVFVNVQDVGDSPPRWLLPPMASSVDENTNKGSELFTVQAIDGDTSVDNNITYSIISEDPEGFVEMVDPTTGKVTLKKDLDREDPDLIDRGFINVVLQARESPKSDPDQACSNITCVNGTALITVNDLEDKSPEFENTSMQADFAENKTGNLDLTVTVTDKDATFQNNYITLSLEGAQKDVFQLQQSSGSGQLQTTIAVVDKDYMDYEQEDHRIITLTVVATGSDPSSPKASATVTVHLTDVNDNSPQFAEVLEETKGAEVPAHITADDADSMAKLEFSIDWDATKAYKDNVQVDRTEYDYTDLFQLSADSSGKAATLRVSPAGAPDREQMDTITLRVVVTDTATESGTDQAAGEWRNTAHQLSDLTVKILDVNDNSPQFQDMADRTFNVTENMPKTSIINQPILATDIDENATITYSVTGNPPPYLQRHRISIVVLDQNDNGPEWLEVPSDVDGLNVTENVKGAAVYTLTATDIDDGPEYNKITYSLSAAAMKNFTVDGETGEISVKKDAHLDREVLADQNFVMTIQVFAGDFCDEDGNCAHKVENLLRVTVLDDNDSPPQFPDQDGYLFDEPETTKSDTQLVGVAASDADQADSPASTLTYRLLDTAASKTGCPDSVQQLFTVETSGKEALVRAGRDLQDCWGVYNITLGATDGEEPFNSGTKQYQVQYSTHLQYQEGDYNTHQ